MTTTTRPATTTHCSIARPSSAVIGITSTSLTFSYQAYGAGCGSPQPVTIRVSQNSAGSDAGSATGPCCSGSVTVTGLSPDTDYYWIASGGGATFPDSWHGPVRTLPAGATTTSTTTTSTTTTSTTSPALTCSVRFTLVAAWPNGFQANVTVTNTSSVPIHRWLIAWTWPGDQRLTAAYGAVAGGTATSPTLSSPNWAGPLAPGASVSTGVLGSGPPPVVLPVLTCTVLS